MSSGESEPVRRWVRAAHRFARAVFALFALRAGVFLVRSLADDEWPEAALGLAFLVLNAGLLHAAFRAKDSSA